MSMHAAIYTRLSTDAGVTALISTRIFPTKAPQNAQLPCIVQRRFGDFDSHVQSGACGLANSTHEFEILADSAASAISVAEAVRNSLDGLHTTVIGTTNVRSSRLTNETDSVILFQGSENERYQIEQDWEFWYFRSIPTL